MARDLQQQLMQGLAALGIEGGDDVLVQPFDQRAELAELPPARRGEAHDVPPPVVRVPTALDQPAFLEGIEEADELAAVDSQRVGDRRLGLALALAQECQDAVVVRAESEELELLDRATLAREAQPPE